MSAVNGSAVPVRAEELFSRIDASLCQSCETLRPTMSNSFDDDFDASQAGPAALLRLEIRYMRRDVAELKDEIRKGLEGKADRAELSKATVLDHEDRLRALERRIYWATGFAASVGALSGIAIRILFPH